jgi:hypothetical protein
VPLSTFLDGRAASQLRGIQWLSMSDTGHVVRSSATDDLGGGITQAWVAGAAVPCRLDPVKAPGGGLTGGRIDERSTHLVTLTAGTTVSTDDRFSIDGRGTFEITALRDRTGEWVREFEVVAT